MLNLEITLQPIGGGWWRWGGDLEWVTSRDYVMVRRGTITDLTSVPRALWTFWPPHGDYLWAAGLHDELYNSQDMSRKDADQLFKEIMKWCHGKRVPAGRVLSIPGGTRNSLYAGVRSGGWVPWRRRALEMAEADARIEKMHSALIRAS